MFAFLCNFYGGMPKDWLETPIRTFFAMFREGVKMEARQYSELADISLISNQMKLEYYFSLKDRYRAIIDPTIPRLPDRPSGPVIESGSADGIKLMKGVARGLKRNLGYGG